MSFKFCLTNYIFTRACFFSEIANIFTVKIKYFQMFVFSIANVHQQQKLMLMLSIAITMSWRIQLDQIMWI